METKALSLRETRVCIVGLGLMGGSLALALRGQTAGLTGVDRDPLTLQMARLQDVVDLATDDLAAAVATADLLVLATPVRTILALLDRLSVLRPDGIPVIDLGSTKAAIVAAMDRLPIGFEAIGGHPMCGKETAGLSAADPGLYRGRRFILCRSARTTPAIEATARDLAAAVGARPLYLPPDRHDAIVAAVSHLPYLTSAALMRLAGSEGLWEVSASGFRDTSRLSGTDPRMMLDILLTNREAVLESLDRYQGDLLRLREWLETGDEEELFEWLATARVGYAAYRRFRSAEGDGPS